MVQYDLIVIGSGPGGYEAALRAAALGMKTALIEKREVGGTCLNRGCVPTKAMLHAAGLVHAAQEGQVWGVRLPQPEVDVRALFARKAQISAELRAGVEGLLESAGVTLFRGTGSVCGTGLVRLFGADGEQELMCTHILIATGSVPARPPIPGLELEGVVTSDELLEGEGRLFGSMVIIGGGVIGVELACFYSAMGCKVTIVEGLDRLLPALDRELGQNLAAILKKQGVQLCTKAMVERVERRDGALWVDFTQHGQPMSARGEAVLCAIGRSPNTGGLLAEGAALEMEGRRIKVDQEYRTSLPGVYAIGDVSSPVQLAHVATAQGVACVERLAGRTPSVDPSLVPSCVYTTPEIACVGLTADQAKEQGLSAVTGKYVMFSNARTLISGAPRSLVKVVTEVGSRRVLGAQLMCPNATDMISQFTQAIREELTADAMLAAIRPHPTFEEGVSQALRAALDKLS